jgi:hypothetical protein
LGATCLEALLQNLPQLLGLVVARVLNGERAALGHDLLGRERPLGEPPSRVGPPPLDSSDLLLELLLLGV